MKNILIALLAVTAAALGAVVWHEHTQLQTEQEQVAEIKTRLTTAETRLKERTEADEKAALAEEKARVLQKTLTELSSESAGQSEQVAKLQQSLAEAKTNAAAPKGLAALFKDPDMKEMIKSQQKAVIGPMIDKMYGPYLTQLNMTPEQTAYVKDLLQKKMLVASEMGVSMLSGDTDAAKRSDMMKQIKEQTDAYDAQLKQFLGDDLYKDFQTYEKSTPDRLAVNQFNDQVAATPTALSADQQNQLIQIMADQRNNFKWTTDFNNAENMDVNTMFTEEKVNQFAQEKERLDQQVLDRARPILTPEQLSQFETFQKSQRDMQVAGMKMAAKMFGQ